MTVGEFDARVLLQVAPDDYVAERSRLVEQARAEHDRARARFYQSLKRPNLSLWAVLASGGDADAIESIVTATKRLAQTQAGGGDAGALSAATRHRREVLEGLVDSAVRALARWGPGADARRAEIRGIIDLLSRHPDLAEAWIDATLRDLPDDTWGFGPFTDMHVTATQHTDGAPKTVGPTRAERLEKARLVRQEVAAAKRDLAVAERRVHAARTALRNAEKEMRVAEAERDAADQRHKQAAGLVEADE